jgi:hypothetical protein
MSLDLTKPIRLKGSREVRKYGGPLGDGHVVLSDDGSFANTTPISMENIESEYENVPENVASTQPPSTPTAELLIETEIGGCCDEAESRYILSEAQVVPGKHRTFVAATNGRVLAIVEVEGEASHRQFIHHSFAKLDKRAKRLKVRREGNEWRTQDGRFREVVKEGRYPDVTKVLVDMDGRAAISVDARYLLALAKAVGGMDWHEFGVTLLLDRNDDSAGIGVIGVRGIGMLMPIAADSPSYRESKPAKECSQFNERAEQFRKAMASSVAEPK